MSTNRDWQKRLVLGGVFAAIICLLTFFTRVQVLGTGAYIHLGDSAIYLGAFLLGPLYGAAAAGIGSMFADLFAGASQYMLVTFIVKALMAVIVGVWLSKMDDTTSGRKVIVPLCVAAAWMMAGYFLYDIALVDLAYALGGLLFNLIQAVAGVLIAIPLINLTGKYKL